VLRLACPVSFWQSVVIGPLVPCPDEFSKVSKGCFKLQIVHPWLTNPHRFNLLFLWMTPNNKDSETIAMHQTLMKNMLSGWNMLSWPLGLNQEYMPAALKDTVDITYFHALA
jgi:hypothetical protein